VDVTVMAITNRDLFEMVEKGEFRMDLYYRMNAFSLNVPPLRERKEDIPVLARHFLATFAMEYNKKIAGFSEAAEESLLAYAWPGNVRELKNVIQGTVVLQDASVIMPEHLHLKAGNPSVSKERGRHGKYVLPEGGISLDEFEKDLIIQALKREDHNKTRAAKLLNVSYDSFRYQLKKFGLE
jgi:two-component system response regulator AtoC